MLHPHERKLVEVGVSGLFGGVFEVDCPLVETHRRARFHSSRSNAPARDALGEVIGGRFGAPAPRYLMVADVHQSVKEGAGGNDDGLGAEGHPPDGGDAYGLAMLHDELVGLVLPDVEVGRMVERATPLPDKLAAVTLCAGRPDGRSLAFVEHAKLYGSAVGDHAHLTAHGVDLAYNLAFSDAADGRVAAHLRNLVHVHRNEASLGPNVGRRRCCLAACMTTADDDDVVIEISCILHLRQK